MAKQFLYCSNIIPGLKKLGGKPVRRVMSGQGPVDFSSQHCDPVFSALFRLRPLSQIMHFKCLKKVISLNYCIVSMYLFPLCLHPKSEVQSVINPQAFEAARGSQFHRICPAMRGIGHLKYHSTSACPPPRIFGKLTSCIIHAYLSLFTINILDPEADALLHAMLFCHAPPYESISKLSFFIGNVDMPACLVKVFQFLRFYAPFSSLSLDPVAGQILAVPVPESGNTIVIRMPFHGFLLCILVMVILVKYWDLVKSKIN